MMEIYGGKISIIISICPHLEMFYLSQYVKSTFHIYYERSVHLV